MSFGVVAFGQALGEPVPVSVLMDGHPGDARTVRGWGYRAFHRAAPDVGLTDLAVRAGGEALDRAGVAPGELDLVVLAAADLAEYLYWDAAAAVQARLGAHRAEALLVNQACGGGVTAFDTVAGRFATHESHATALIIGANRVCEEYCDRLSVNTCVNGDGAAAALVRRGAGSCRWLVTETLTDGRYADFYRLDAGGSARPFTPARAVPARIAAPADRLQEFFGGDIMAMFDFARTTLARNREVLERACARAGVTTGSIARIVHLHDNLPAFTDLAGELGVPIGRTNADLAMAHGHLGCADQIFGLGRLVETGELVPGDLVALTSVSSGMHWTCTLLRV
ncbi:3-oxoacyl-ACP synthase [Nonomuraea sp. WAC 01424]|uniref:3-oxoacyl-ACP synthase III family protein n=1 Tax=Nonomuraea sp. WAC 01424 TaxID=2203200 RepID=UPI000F766F89|nr:3-oxoacyl-[acyl-carrier-protein] synthase III C-terminal domain-containing protein [Nonomuraea sp. WAC 01424]RSN11505.1 3-oxoacyl-ACP synthase [Nonomuraea sp. WAC 01424]